MHDEPQPADEPLDGDTDSDSLDLTTSPWAQSRDVTTPPWAASRDDDADDEHDGKALSVTSYPAVSSLLRRKEKTWLPCEFCGKKFDRPSLLKRHMRTHTGLLSSTCH